MDKTYKVEFEHLPLGSIFLSAETTMSKDGFGEEPHIYPVTIVQARYNGTYEGGRWLAFPVAPHHLSYQPWAGWNDSDIECMEFWGRARREDWPIGRGNSPDDALYALLNWVCAKAGVKLSDLEAPPTWDRDVLAARSGDDDLLDL